MSYVDGCWMHTPLPECQHVKVPFVFLVDTRMVSVDALETNGHLYILRRILGKTCHDSIQVRLANRLRLVPTGGGIYEPAEECAIKIWDVQFFLHATSDEKPRAELATMQLLSAVGDLRFNRLLDYFKDDTFVYMVIPYMLGGDLFERMFQHHGPLSDHEARTVMNDIMTHLTFMKKHGIAHRDISLENVMINVAGAYNMIDLGMSVRMPTFTSGAPVYTKDGFRGGKPSYMSPEVAREDVQVDPFASDVWALGVVLFILLTRVPLYERANDPYFQMVCGGRLGELLDHYQKQGIVISPLARSMILRMLDINPNTRLTLEQSIQHPWMQAGALESDPESDVT